MKKRIFSLILAGVLFASVSCGGGSSAGDDSAATSGSEQSGRLAELGAKDFGGKTFTVLDANDHPEMHVNIPGEEMNGDIVNDALIERSTFLEDTYKVKMEYETITNAKTGITTLKNCVLAGDDSYQLVISTILGGTLGTVATEGILSNLCDNPYLSLDKSWWSQLMYESLNYNDTMYFTTGDITPTMYQMPACIYLNKKLLTDYNITTDYAQLVRDGKWTMDELVSLTKDKNRDLNEDNLMSTADDFFGLVHQSVAGLTTNALLTASGISISETTKDGTLICDLSGEKTLNAVEKLKPLITKDLKVGKSNDHLTLAFKENRAIAAYQYVEGSAVLLRDMESDYIILPLPKYDANQETYRSFCNGWANAFIAIPTTADPEFAGFITEAMGYYSLEKIRPQAFDLVYYGKAVRDDDSAEMLDVIFDTLYLDFGCIYDFGGVNKQLGSVLSGKAEFASALKSVETVIASDIETFMNTWGK